MRKLVIAILSSCCLIFPLSHSFAQETDLYNFFSETTSRFNPIDTHLVLCKRGDANSDNKINFLDIIYLVKYIFKGGASPSPLANGDVDCRKGVRLSDIVYLANYVFKKGPPPCIPLELLSVQATSPKLANGLDPCTVSVYATDSCGNPVSNASIRVLLIVGDDEAEGLDAESLGNGNYRALLISVVAGTWIIQARDLKTDVSSHTFVKFLPGRAFSTHINIGNVDTSGQTMGFEIFAFVLDSSFNKLPPPLSNVKDSTNFGTLDSLKIDSIAGLYTTTLRANNPGIARVTARDAVSGIEDTVDVVFPAVELSCPPAIHLSEDTLKVDTIPVSARIFVGPNHHLVSYSLTLRLNHLTNFLGAKDGNPSDAFLPCSVTFIPPDTLIVTQAVIDTLNAPKGTIEPCSLFFECKGEGTSEVEILDAQLLGFQLQPDSLELLQNQPRSPARCENKSVKKVCINVILVSGFLEQLKKLKDREGRLIGIEMTKEQVEEEVKKQIEGDLKDKREGIQQNLDKACCKIEIKLKTFKEMKKPDRLSDEQKTSSDPKNPVIGVEWNQRLKPPDKEANKIILSEGIFELLTTKERDKDCINVFLVDFQLGRFPNEDGKVVIARFGGADIRRTRIRPDGKDCESIKIFKRFKDEKKEVKEEEIKEDVDVTSVIVVAGSFIKLKDKDKNIVSDGKTLKHEIGHLLGLRHPWEYVEAITKQIKDEKPSSVMEYSERNESSSFTKKECELIMELPKCSPYLKDP